MSQEDKRRVEDPEPYKQLVESLRQEAYQQQTNSLRADLKIVIRLTRQVRAAIIEGSNQKQPSARYSQEEIERCKRLVEECELSSIQGKRGYE